ncbi:hypothetical protein THIX_50053 [Thiomonas sp. X19]|nr:hypothetical protein THIX_50053 [Thiomonas sp. X19]
MRTVSKIFQQPVTGSRQPAGQPDHGQGQDAALGLSAASCPSSVFVSRCTTDSARCGGSRCPLSPCDSRAPLKPVVSM